MHTQVLSSGTNTCGQLGWGAVGVDGGEHAAEWGPVCLSSSAQARQWRQVACGGEHTALLDAAGVLFVFGGNSQGQLGLGTRLSCTDAINTTDVAVPLVWQHARATASPLLPPPGPVAQVCNTCVARIETHVCL